MTDEDANGKPVGDRDRPIGQPAVRGDPGIVGDRAETAIEFDHTDPESLEEATTIAREFLIPEDDPEDELSMLRGGAACATLVRGEGSYREAARRIDDSVTISLLRKWTRVHDLPLAIRRHIATGEIPPTAAVQIARLTGDDRLLLAWSVLDGGLSVDDVRRIASDVSAGRSLEDVLETYDVTLGEVSMVLPLDVYVEWRRVACLEYSDPGEIGAEAFERWREDRGNGNGQ